MAIYVLRTTSAAGANINGSFWKTAATGDVDMGDFSGVLWLTLPLSEIPAALLSGVIDAFVTTDRAARETVRKAFEDKDSPLYLGSIGEDGLVRDRLVNVTTLEGDGRDNTIRGSAGIDEIFGRGGDDRLSGLGGSDLIKGGGGDDTLRGGEGADRLFGDGGSDLLRGGAGGDQLFGGSGRDRLFGDAGPDRLAGGTGNDRLDGGDSNDTLFGGGGADALFGGAGDDTLSGGDGSDKLFGGGGWDVFLGGGGDDRLYGDKGEFVGGAGRDRFVFVAQPGDGFRQYDVRISDFEPGIDKLDFRQTGFGGLGDFTIRETASTFSLSFQRALVDGVRTVASFDIVHVPGETPGEGDFIF